MLKMLLIDFFVYLFNFSIIHSEFREKKTLGILIVSKKQGVKILGFFMYDIKKFAHQYFNFNELFKYVEANIFVGSVF